MTKNLIPRITESIYEVMETMFYYEIEEDKDTGSDFFKLADLNSLKTCHIQFSGSYSGFIYLCIPLKVLKTITCNFLGEETLDDKSEEYLDSTLKEALNMIAGNALTKMDKESFIQLGIPELVESSGLAAEKDIVTFNTREGKIASFFSLNN